MGVDTSPFCCCLIVVASTMIVLALVNELVDMFGGLAHDFVNGEGFYESFKVRILLGIIQYLLDL